MSYYYSWRPYVSMAEKRLHAERELTKLKKKGQSVAPVRIDRSLRKGLCFMTLHFQDQVKTNILTVDYTDPRSGTAEFKACAIRVEPVRAGAERQVVRRSPEA